MCCERILRHFRLSRAKKKIFWELAIFLLFLHIRGHRFLEKWPTTLFERYQPEICRGLHKWCCETNFKAFKVVSSKKKIFQKIWIFFTFFAYPGSQISWKMTNYFFERYGPEICRGLHKWCCERILRHFRLFRAKKNFFLRNWQFLWLFLHIRGHRFLEKWPTSFLRGTGLKFFQLLFWEIRAWNFSWTAQMVLRTNFEAL